MPKTHVLKCWPEPFNAILERKKRHEIRVNDRDFQEGDTLELREFIPPPDPPRKVIDLFAGEYTGRKVLATITYISEGGTWGLPENLCVMTIQ